MRTISKGGVLLLTTGVIAIVAIAWGFLPHAFTWALPLKASSTIPPASSTMEDAIHPTYLMSLTEGVERPMAVDVTADGKVYVADRACSCIRVFDSDGNLTSTLGPKLQGGGEIGHPVALTVDENQVLYVSDLSKGQVLMFKEDSFLGILEEGDIPSNVSSPAGILVQEGFIYINDLSKHQVLIFELANGALVRTIGAGKGTEPGEMAYPNFSLIMNDGSLIVADSNNNRLQVFNSSGKLEDSMSKPVLLPRGMALDKFENIHVVSTMGGVIEVLDNSGQYIGTYQAFQGVASQFGFPTGIAIHNDRIYVSDRANQRVLVGTWP